MEIIQSKSILAKLMATENLIIEHRKVSTASFDVKNRILTVPILDKNISPQLYDLFMGHEVGHALYTPLDGLQKAIDMGVSRSICNVIEDHRIERKVKYKYPGIRKSFVVAYKELVEKNFFGTNGMDLNDLNFIDRFNLFSKIGPAQGIKFNEQEKKLVDEIDAVETYDDVIKVAIKVKEYLKEEKEEKQKNNPNIENFDEEEDEELEGYDDTFDEFDDDYENYGDDDSDDFEETEEDDDSGQPAAPKDAEKSDVDDDGPKLPEARPEENGLESITDKIFEKSQSQLFENDNRHYYYGDIPKIDLNEVIMPYKEVWSTYRSEFEDWKKQYGAAYVQMRNINIANTKEFIKVREDAKKVVSYLAKEFEMRKNADQLKRASIAKTGELNMNKIYAYKFTEDIFKKMTIVPDGKSHGLVMFLDWSGSMNKHLTNTVKQLINLVMFCKKVNIPYEVYAFCSQGGNVEPDASMVGQIVLSKFKLLNFLSSKMSASEFSYGCSALLSFSMSKREFSPKFISLGGTPINEAIISAMEIVPKFQKDYKLQVVNTVFLTDGDGHKCDGVWSKSRSKTADGREMFVEAYNDETLDAGSSWQTEKILVIRDPLTKNQETFNRRFGTNRQLTASYIKLLKSRTNCNVVGFFILSGRDFNNEIRSILPDLVEVASLKAKFRSEKYSIITSSGYDEYYLLRAEGLDIDEDVEFEVKENASTRTLTSAFKKYAGNRLSNRVVLNRFVGLIA